MIHAFGKSVQKHPTLDILCRDDGLVCIKGHGFGHSKRHWTRGSRTDKGYLVVGIDNKVYPVHRLIAETFIPNPHGFPVVDHIDRERNNNVVTNLRWTTYVVNARNSGPCYSQKTRDGFHAYDNPSEYDSLRGKAYRLANPEHIKELWVSWASKNKKVRFPEGKKLWLKNELAEQALAIPFNMRSYEDFKKLKGAQ